MKIALATTIVVSSLTFICGHEHGLSTHHRRLAKGSKADMSLSMPDSPRSPDSAKGRKLHLTDTDEHRRLSKGSKADMSLSMPDSPRSPDSAKGRKPHLTDTHHRLAKGEKDMSMPDSPRSPDAKAEKMSMPSDAKGRKLRA